jgi:hypothetical protein
MARGRIGSDWHIYGYMPHSGYSPGDYAMIVNR